MSRSKMPSIIVPARLESTRFPHKLLSEVGGKPLIIITAERVAAMGPEFDLFFAVDGKEIGNLLEDSGYQTIYTDPFLPSGTDRIASANKILQREKIINVQADEPMVDRTHLIGLTEALEEKEASMSTLAVPFDSKDDFTDPNQVKVVLDEKGFALYFSRSPIPYDQSGQTQFASFQEKFSALRHIGMYGYRSDFLQKFSQTKLGELEKIERLEQLRALEMGAKIAVSMVEHPTIGIDSPEDLQRFKKEYISSIK